MRRRTRFPGAGSALKAEFNRQLKQNVRDDWTVWAVFVVAITLFVAWSELENGDAARFLAATAGGLAGMAVVLLALGGRFSTLHFSLGAEGERLTGKEIEKLGPEWHCEHSILREKGDWDHVLIGPPGVFLVDSKFLHGKASVDGDALRSGRMKYEGKVFRGSAVGLNKALEERLGRRAPFVRPFVAVWGNFSAERVEENGVTYVDATKLAPILAQLPPALSAPDRAALVTALTEVRGGVR